MNYSDVVKHNLKCNPWFVRLWKILMTNIDIEGLSDSQDKRYILKKLIEQGKVVSFIDDEMGQLLLPCILSGKYNIYDVPLEAEVRATNGYHRKINLKDEDGDGVLIYCDYTRHSLVPLIVHYSEILTEIDNTIMLNVKVQKTPFFVEATNENAEELKKMLSGIRNYKEVVVGHKTLANNIEVFKTDAPYLCDKLTQLKMDYINEFLSLIGINNSNISKLAQIQSDEINANNEMILVGEASFIDCLNECFDKSNKKLGTNYHAKPRIEYSANELMGGVLNSQESEVESDGNKNENIN